MKAYMGNGCIAPLIHIFCARKLEWLASNPHRFAFKKRAPGYGSKHPVPGAWVGEARHCVEEINFFTLLGFEYRIVQTIAYSVWIRKTN